MRRVILAVPPHEVEPALDGLLPLLVRGVRGLGGGAMAADGTSLSREELEAAAGRPFTRFEEVELSGTAGHEEPMVDVGGRLVVRAPSQPAPQDGRVDVVIERHGSAFGSGDHPTTRLSLALLCDLPVGDGLADLGCGLGTLAIAAAGLGWTNVVGVDRDPESVEVALRNAERNAVAAELWVADLLESDIPYRSALLVNAPPEVHARVADGLPESTLAVVASSFMAGEAEAVAAPYREKGLDLVRVGEDGGWAALLLARPGVVEYGAVPPEEDLVAGLDFATPDEVKPPPLAAATLLDPDHVMRGGAVFGQLAKALPEGGVTVSAARLIERGARAAILHVPGLFRFDLMPGREAFSVSLRELCDAPMRWEADAGTVDGFRREKDEPMVFRGGIQLPDARLSIGLQALSAADEAEAVAAPYREKGLELVRACEDGGWAALLLARPDVVEYQVPPEEDLVAGLDFAAPDEVKPPPLAAATLLDPDHVMRGGAVFGQLATALPEGGVAVSAARLIERGARAAILHVPGLFRFDLMPGREAFSVSLRELCDAPMRWEADAGTVDGFRREKNEPMVFRGGIQLPDARLSIGLQALSAADEDQGAVHVVATAAVRVV